MTQLNTLELAKQGDTNAINTLVIEWLGLPSITAKTSLKQDCLQVMLESANIPEQNSLVPLIHDGLIDLGIPTITKVKIFGREAGEDFPDWQQELELEVQPNSLSSTLQAGVGTESSTAITTTPADTQLSIQQPSRLGSLFGVVAGTAEAVGSAAFHTGKTVAKTALGIGGAIGGAASGAAGGIVQTGQAVAGTAMEIGGAISDVTCSAADGAVQTGQAVAGAALGTAYGMNLKDSERKAEALAIFGLGLGGKTAIKAGLGLLRNLPVAGAVIGASSNAVMIYALGYAACQFYEAKQNPLTLQATLVDAQIESEKYLEAAISQEKIMDQILVHIVLAGNPNKSWEEILPELQTANLSPASIDAIAANMKSPPSLETLLKQVNSDFAVPLLAQCHKIAHLDGVITAAEAKVIETIKQKLKRN
ncbi:hypothetical protein BV378_23615 [Nostoc sp. RF31YmG]|nr:hypothetical protein BV378_23615 [Nostoc sp. RF31YmG]